jgi:hypothetical protein
MLNGFAGREIQLKGEGDEWVTGLVLLARSPMLTISLPVTDSFVPGQLVQGAYRDESSYYEFDLVVVETEGNTANVWVQVTCIRPGFDRAPRAKAPSIPVRITQAGTESLACLSNVSATGMLISSLQRFEPGEQIQLELEFAGPIRLEARAVRTIQNCESNYVDIGLEITQADKLSEARWLHLVSALLRRSPVAA